MALPDRNNPYNFDSFLEWRSGADFYGEDTFAREAIRHYTGEQWEEVDRAAREVSAKVSFRWSRVADAIAVPEKKPYLVNYDAHRHRIDRLVRPLEMETMEKEVFGEALFSKNTPPWVKLAKMFVIYQMGESCLACPLTCTEGLVAVMEQFADSPEVRDILAHCQEGRDGDFAIGAQYLSEIQGGSDVPANLLEAVNENGVWRLYGSKFFCSAVHADYAAVTAKPAGSEQVALFVMPSWLPGDKVREVRNGYTIDRIKWKMGTSELPTAEITFNGAVAYPIGPLERGLANVVGIVLTYSRLTVGLSSAAFMVRAAREARKYAEFREAFGQRLDRFPMVAGQLDRLDLFARRTTAGAFRLYRDFLELDGLKGGLVTDEPEDIRRKRFDIRELIMLQKITAAWDAPEVGRLAMSIFGGHGVMEDFSCLPRLYRDAAVNELWEGPRNVLLTQIHRDLQRVAAWYPPADFAASLLKGAEAGLVSEMSREITELVAHPSLLTPDAATREVCLRWDDFCHRLGHACQDLALAEVLHGDSKA